MQVQMTRRQVMTGIGAGAAGALIAPAAEQAQGTRVASSCVGCSIDEPNPPPPAAAHRGEDGAASRRRAFGRRTARHRGSCRTARYGRPALAGSPRRCSRRPAISLTELVVFVDPGGQTGSVRLTQETLTGPVDLVVGSYGSGSGLTTLHLFVRGQPLYADPESNAYTIGIDLKPGVTLYGASVIYFSATTSFVFIDPVRVWDSRTSQGALLIPGANAGGRKFTGTEFGFTVDTVIPRFSYGPLLNVTLTDTLGGGYAVVWGKGELDPFPPPISNVNWYGPNQTVANLVVTRMVGEADITLTFGGAGSTHVVIDVLGYFT